MCGCANYLGNGFFTMICECADANSDVQMCKYEDVQMSRYADVGICRCANDWVK